MLEDGMMGVESTGSGCGSHSRKGREELDVLSEKSAEPWELMAEE